MNLPFGVYQTKIPNPVMLDFCDAFDGNSGVAVITDGLPGLHLDGGNVEVLVGDGFPPLRGKHSCRLAIYPHRGNWRAGDAPRRALEFQDAPAAIPAVGPVKLPLERSFLESTGTAVLSALYVDRGQTLARFYDTYGRGQPVEARWSVAWQEAWAARLDGRRGSALTVAPSGINFDLPEWGIFTMALGAGEGGQA